MLIVNRFWLIKLNQIELIKLNLIIYLVLYLVIYAIIITYISTVQKLAVNMIFFFFSLLCSPRLPLFDKKYSKKSNIVKYSY